MSQSIKFLKILPFYPPNITDVQTITVKQIINTEKNIASSPTVLTPNGFKKHPQVTQLTGEETPSFPEVQCYLC